MTSKRISMLRNSSSLFALGAASALLTGGPAHAFDANSLPQGGNVTGGAATIATSGNTLTVNQSSNRAVIDWRSFDIGANAQANFNQPGASAIAVNRVNASTDPSRIEGGLHASGQVWILNPNGVMFGKTARVDAAGVVATTANIDDKAFMAGDNKLQMRGGDSGQVVNEGHITIGQGGMAAFVAPSVRNSGTIRARVGRVTLAAGDTYTLDLAGDRLVEIGLGAGKAVVDQSGKIVNEGGVITISAKAAGQAVDSLINMSGVLDASSVKTAGGKIVLGADTINIASAATLKADGTSGGQITVVADKTGNYAGSYSAQGSQGDGGQVETSGKAVHIDSKIAVNTSAPKGKTGSWTLDPNDLTVTAGNGGTITSGINTDAQSTVGADAVVAALASTNVTLQAKNSITVNSAIDASGNGVAHNLTLADQDGGGLTVNLNAAITLKSGGVLSGGATVVNLTNGALIQNGNDVALANSAINLNGGIYAPGATLSKSGLSLIGANGAEIDVNPGNNQVNAIAIAGNTDGVSVSGLVIRGEVTGSYVDYAFGSGMSRGVAVVNGATNFTISGNDIRNVRVGILIDGRNTGSITGNTIDNTKGAVLVQYTDAGVGNSQGYAINISGNHQGPTGNEWGIDTHLNGFWNGTAIVSYPGGAAPSGVQATLLASSAANDGWTVQDQAYTASNRTAVTVATTGSNANQGSARTPLATIQAGINAIVTGGTVNVKDGTYVVSAANGYTNGYLGIGKSLKLIGQSQAGVIIDARNASTYGIRVIGGTDSVSLSNFTLLGVAATNAYGIKVEDSTNFSIDHVTSKGAYKAQLDLNGVRGGTVSFVTADGTSNGVGAGSTKGAAIAITDSQNLTISNSSVIGGAYGGIGIYQSNKPSGYTYQTSNVTIDGSNTFNANGAAHYNYVYTEDESATNNFGTLTIAGFDYVAGQDSNSADTFKYFQRTQQGAIDYLDSIGAVNVGYVEGWTGSAVNNRFAVANATGGNAMAINPALTAAAAGATITVAPGVYAETLNITRNVDITGAGIGQTIIRPTTLLNTGVAHKYDANVKATVFVNGASNVNLSGLTIDGNNLGNNAVVFWNNASGSISNSRIVNPQAFNGAQTGQDLAVDATGSTTSNLTISGVQFANWNKNAIDVVTGGGSISGGGNVTLNVNNSSFAGQGATGLNAQNGIVLWERGGSGSTINATVDHSTFSGITYTGTDSNATGILLYGATTGSLTVKNSTFDNSVQNYIGTDGGSLVEINATTGNIFDGVAEGGATLDQLFNIENHLVDGTDNAGNSLVRLKSGQVYVTAAKNSIQNGVSAATAGDTVNVQAGTYAGGIAINTNGITLQGQSGTVIAAGGGSSSNAITVNGDNVTVRNLAINLAPTGGAQINGVGISGSADGATLTGLTIRGEVAGSYQDYAFGSAMSRGVYVQNGATNFAISGNDIRNVRVGILADGAANLGSSPNNTGSITGNIIDNTKGGVLIQYTDGAGITITGNRQDAFGNEWGEDFHLQGAQSGVATNGAQLLAASAANGGWTVQDLAYASSNRTAVTVAANATNANVNPSDSNQGSSRTPLKTIQAGINAVVAGGTVNVLNGTYVVSSGYINVDKSLNLVGQSQGQVIVDARNASTYGLRVTASNGPVSISNLTLYGVTATGGYGLKAEATRGLTLANVTSQGAAKSEFDLNGVIGATLTNLTANGASVATGLATNGNGVSLTDSQNIVLTNVTTRNDLWGGLALYESNSPTGYTTQMDNITVDGSNTFTEANGIYAQDQSSLHDFGSINLAGQGIAYVAKANVGGTEGTYTWFQKTQQGAIDLAAAAPVAAAVQGYAGNSVAGNNIFTVGIATNGTALSVNAALDQSLAGGVIHVADGTYAENVALSAARTVDFGTVSLNSLTLAPAAAGTVLSGRIAAGSVALNGAVVLGGNLSLNATSAVVLASADGAHDLSVVSGAGASLGNLGSGTRLGAVSVSGNTILTGSSYKAGSIVLGATTLAANTSLDATGTVTLASANGAHDLGIVSGAGTSLGNLGNSTRLGAVTVSGGTILTGSSYKAGSFDLGVATLGSDASLDATGTVTLASVDGAHALAVASTGASLGNLGSSTRLGAVSVSGNTVLTGSSYKAASLNLGATTLALDTTLDASGAVTLASADGAHALTIASGGGTSLGDLGDTTRLGAVSVSGGTALTGSSYKTASLNLGATTLALDTTLDATGAVILASADGAHALTIASTGTSLGDLGDTTRLGAVSVSGGTALTGGSYKAASLNLGATTLALDTTLDATGAVILASADGAHALTIASTGTSLGDLGDTTRLGAVSVSGNTTLTGSSYKAGSIALGATTLASDTSLDATGAVTLASADGAHALTIASIGTSLGDLGDTTRLGAVSVSGGSTLTGGSYKAGSLNLGVTTLASDASLDATGTVTLASADGAHALIIASTGTSLGDLGDTTRLGAVSVSGNATLTGSSYKAGSLNLGATTLASDASLDATGAVTLASADGAHALTISSGGGSNLGNLGSTTRLGAVSVLGNTALTGGSYKADSFNLGATTLASDTSLDATGAVTLASADGAHALTIASSGTSLGDLGDTTRLGALSVSGGTTLTGSSYKAASIDLGATTLTAAITTLDTASSPGAAGNIAISGDIFGTKDGGQSLVLAAGTGSGAKSANGDVSLKNAGTTAVRLGDLKISGDDFLALTVDIAGGFTSHLTGNQVFAADTLNAGGAVNTNAVGDVSGHIVAAGNVSLSAGGAVSGNITGDALTLNSASVGNASLQGNSLDATVSGNFNAAVATTGNVNTNVTGNVSGQIASGGNVSLNAGGGVSGNISGNALTLNSGSVSGATLQGNSLNATVAGDFNAAVTTTGNVNTKVAGNLSGQIASGGNVSLNTGGGVSGNISGNALTLNSGSVSGATLQGNSLNATVAGNFDAAVATTGNVSTNVTGNVSGQIASGGNVALNAGGLVSGNIKGDALTVNSGSVGGGATLAGNTVVAIVTGNFDAAVNTSGSSSVSGNTVTGSFTGSTVSLSGQSVSGQVNAGTLNVSAQDGAVTGNFTPGDVSSSVPLNGGVVGTNPNNYLPQQLVVEGFVLPAGTQIAANGQLILPPGTVIGLMSPGGGTPRVTMVQSVQQLGELLESGYTAIVIDLNARKKTTKLASN